MAEPERVWQLVHPGLELRLPEPTPGTGTAAGRGRIPTPRTPLVGRDHDRRLVADRLRTERIVTLSGVGGVGKTRLAIDAAVHLAGFDLVEFVPLAGLSAADDVAAAIAGVLGATIALDPGDAVVAALGPKPALLVIDNCEHVLDGAATVIDTLVGRCPQLSVLATSREPLGIDGEYVIPVRPLRTSTDAVELFRQRASAAGADLDDVPREVDRAAVRAARRAAARDRARRGPFGHASASVRSPRRSPSTARC